MAGHGDYTEMMAELGRVLSMVEQTSSLADLDDMLRRVEALPDRGVMAAHALNKDLVAQLGSPSEMKLRVLIFLRARRFDLSNDLTDLDQAIRFADEVAQRAVPGEEAGDWLRIQAELVEKRWELQGTRGDLDRALELLAEAQTMAVSVASRALTLSHTAWCLLNRWQVAADRSDLDRAVLTAGESLTLSPDGPDRARCLELMAWCLRELAGVTGNRSDMDAAVELATQALGITRGGPGEARSYGNLGGLLKHRWQLAGDRDDLDRAISLSEAAVERSLVGEADRLRWLDNLAGNLFDRWQLMAHRNDLERAIQLGKEVVDLTPSGPYRATRLGNHSRHLAGSFVVTGIPADLDQAIAYSDEACARTPTGSTRSERLAMLALQLQMRWQFHSDSADIRRAIRLMEEALELASGPARVARLGQLARLIAERWEALGNSDDLHRSIALAEEALNLTSNGQDKALRLETLASLLNDRFLVARDPADLERAITLTETGLELPYQVNRAERMHGLGAYLLNRFQLSRDPADLDRAIELWRAVLDAPQTSIRAGLSAARDLSRAALELNRPNDAVTAAHAALDQAENLVGALGSGATDWLDLVQGITGRGAYALADGGDPAAAARLLERGSQLLAADRRTEAWLNRAEAAGYTDLVSQFRVARAKAARQLVPPDAVADAPTGAQLSLPDARRAVEDVTGPLHEPDAEAAILAVTATGPLSYLLACEVGGAAITVHTAGGGVETVLYRLPKLTTAAVVRWIQLLESREPTARPNRARGWAVEPDPERAAEVVAGLAHSLAPLNIPMEGLRVVPNGTLARLPLGAVLAQQPVPRPLRLAASAKLLVLAASNAAASTSTQLAAVADPMPCTVDGLQWPRLDGARAEGIWLEEQHHAVLNYGSDATKAAVIGLLGQPLRALHLAAHGLVDPERQLESRLLLCDGPAGDAEALTIGELIGTASSARLVFLAACWLGRAEGALPDEAISFPNLLIEAGTGAVIAPLWPVGDRACEFLVERFYTSWLDDHNDLATALARAQYDTRMRFPFSPTWAAFTLTGT